VTNVVRRSSTRHHFAYLTSGFNAVTNSYMHAAISDLLFRLEHGEFDELLARGYFDPGNIAARRLDVSYYHEGAERRHEDKKLSAISRRMLHNMFEIYEEDNVENLKQRCHELLNYFSTQYPGKKDMALVQQLKGRCREFESESKWASYGFIGESVRHLRLGFYKGDLFTEVPRADRDVPPILELLEEVGPDIVTVAFDPEGSGPDTHYKVLQAVAEALKAYEKKTGRAVSRWWVIATCGSSFTRRKRTCSCRRRPPIWRTWTAPLTPASTRSGRHRFPVMSWMGLFPSWPARSRSNNSSRSKRSWARISSSTTRITACGPAAASCI
jgi:glucosamine-6-phosphate deaminase